MALKDNNDYHRGAQRNISVFGIIICTFSIIICFLGVWLVYLKSTGVVKFNLFGQEFYSNNVGIAAIFIGAVSFILAFRRIIKSMERVNASYKSMSSKILDSNLGDEGTRQ